MATPVKSFDPKTLQPNQVNTGTLQTPVITTNPITAAIPQVSPSISVEQFNTKPFTIRPPVPLTGADSTQEYIASLTASTRADSERQMEQQQEIEKLQATDSKLKTGVGKLMENLGLSGQRKEELYQEGGVDTARMEVDSFTSQIEAEQLANRRAVERLEKNPQGLFGGALQDEINRLNRESVSKQADLAILQNAALRRYDTAAAIADRKIAAETEVQKAQLDTLRFFYDDNKEQLNKKDQRAYEELITQKDREYQEEVSKKKSIQEMVIDAAQGGAPSAVLQQAQRAQTVEEAAALLGRYSLDAQAKRASIANIYSQIADRNASANPAQVVTPPIVNPETGMIDPSNQLAAVLSNPKVKDNTKLQDINGVVAATQQFAQENMEGSFAGLGPVGSLAGRLTLGPQGQANQTSINAINLKVQQWASGASLTKEQTKQVENIVPKKTDTDKQVKQKINALSNFMLNQAKGILTSQGIPYTPEKIDYFKPVIDQQEIDEIDAILEQ